MQEILSQATSISPLSSFDAGECALRCICSEHTTASQYVRVLETDFWFEAHVALRCSGALHSTALQELRLERPGQDSSYEPAMGRVKLAIKPSLEQVVVEVEPNRGEGQVENRSIEPHFGRHGKKPCALNCGR